MLLVTAGLLAARAAASARPPVSVRLAEWDERFIARRADLDRCAAILDVRSWTRDFTQAATRVDRMFGGVDVATLAGAPVESRRRRARWGLQAAAARAFVVAYQERMFG
jgi:hypothetical protein